jgi:hypothetical protein
MKIKPNLESCVCVAVVVLCLAALLLAAFSYDQFRDTKIVYQAF